MENPFLHDDDFFKSAELLEEGMLIKHKYVRKIGSGANAKYIYKEGQEAKKQIQKEGEKDTKTHYEIATDKYIKDKQTGGKKEKKGKAFFGNSGKSVDYDYSSYSNDFSLKIGSNTIKGDSLSNLIQKIPNQYSTLKMKNGVFFTDYLRKLEKGDKDIKDKQTGEKEYKGTDSSRKYLANEKIHYQSLLKKEKRGSLNNVEKRKLNGLKRDAKKSDSQRLKELDEIIKQSKESEKKNWDSLNKEIARKITGR